MYPAFKDKLLKPHWLRSLVRRVFATGDTVRRAVQKPIVDGFVPKSGERAIDIGAGRGMYTLETLTRRFNKVTAIDISHDHLVYLSERKVRDRLTHLSLVRASADHLPFKAGVFDTALCTEVIEHLENDRAGISEIARLVKSNGSIVLSVPVPPAPRYDGAHVHEGYTFDQLSAMLKTQGLRIVDKDYCLLFITRGVLHVIAFFEQRLRVPPPIAILCYLERWIFRFGKEKLRPYDIVVNVRREGGTTC
jgi:ubiquinone/menaquinone biosynthesis C-methylase UbiE